MRRKMLRPCIVKVSVLGYFHLYFISYNPQNNSKIIYIISIFIIKYSLSYKHISRGHIQVPNTDTLEVLIRTPYNQSACSVFHTIQKITLWVVNNHQWV